jgi:regulator of protease activity HflC (stomatin/prohibitin superfamily)
MKKIFNFCKQNIRRLKSENVLKIDLEQIPLKKIPFGKIAIGLFTLFVIKKTLKVIPVGNVGVVDTFGKVNENVLEPGIHIVNPLSKVVNFSLKTNKLTLNIKVPSQEGLNVELEASVQ